MGCLSGELVHVDVKKLGSIPDGGGHKALGRQAGRARRSSVGFDYVHSAFDDHSRLAYSEIHPDEKAATCAAFLRRAAALLHHLRHRPHRAAPDRQRIAIPQELRLAGAPSRPRLDRQAHPHLPPSSARGYKLYCQTPPIEAWLVGVTAGHNTITHLIPEGAGPDGELPTLQGGSRSRLSPYVTSRWPGGWLACQSEPPTLIGLPAGQTVFARSVGDVGAVPGVEGCAVGAVVGNGAAFESLRRDS
ncbi:hypothetical protein SUDANB51_05559 [Streptomyces sp. enrichment culture]